MLNFIRLCTELNISYLDESGHHHAHDGWVQVNCPFCTDGTHGWHLGYSLDGGSMNCWRCGKHSLREFLALALKHKSISVSQAIRKYEDKTFVPTKKEAKIRRKKATVPPYMSPLKSIHKTYLKETKFKKGIIQEWDLWGTTGMAGKWSWRIIAPIRDENFNIVSYSGRAISKAVIPRWKHSKNEEMSMDPRRIIYGIEKIQDRVLIVEGISDVWRMGPGAVGLLGIDWKIEQASILKNFSHRFIMFDPERLAQKRAKELAEWLSPFKGETEIISGLKTDPGDLDQNEADRIMKELGF